MSRALNAARREGAAAAVLLGTDAADLEPQDLREAARLLRADADAVIQPAQDGGYVLIGMRGRIALGLPGIAWSSGRECAQTLVRMRGRRLEVALLRTRTDIDHPADVRRARRAGQLR